MLCPWADRRLLSCQRIITYYGKILEVLVKSPISLLSPPRFSAADQLPPHALPALPNTWPGCGYLRGRNQDVVASGSVAIASVPTHSVASYRRSLLQPRPERIYSPISNAIISC